MISFFPSLNIGMALSVANHSQSVRSWNWLKSVPSESRLEGSAFKFDHDLLDVSTLDSDMLLTSPLISDNVVALLTNLRNQRAAVKAIVVKVAEAPEEQRAFYLQALLTLAGLRRVEVLVEEEARKMPVLDDILENKVLGREYKRGEMTVIRRQIAKRFGSVPASVDQQLQNKSVAELEEIGVRLLDVNSVDELLQ